MGIFLLLLSSLQVSAHGNQVGYCVLSNGFIRVYIEHWHGDLTLADLQGNTINVTTTYGATSINQNVNASGAVNNTAWNNLPGCGAGITILSGCAGGANQYNDWGYFDFAPAACGVPVSITVNAGNTVIFEEACSNLYPVTVNAIFNDNEPPVLTCPVVNVTSCVPLNVNFAVTAVDACDPNPTVTYSIAPGSLFNPGTTQVTATATDNLNHVSTCTFNVNVNPPALTLTAASNSPCAGASLNLNVTAVSGATYAWVGPNGFTSTSQNPSIAEAQVSNSGNYTVTVVIPGGCTYYASVNATVYPNPVVNAGNDVTFCTGGTQLNATVTDPTPPVTGSFTVCVYDAPGGNGNCNFSANNAANNLCNDGYQFLNSAVTSAPFTIAGASNITSIQFQAYWTCANGDWTIQLNGVTIGTSGILSNSICNCTASAASYPGVFTISGAQINANWNVNGPNTLTVIPNSPGSNAVAGFKATVNYNNTGSYSWSPSAGLSSTTIANPVANPAATTTYILTYTSAAGCIATDDVTVTIQCCVPPVVTCPADIIVNNTTGQCSANVSYEATATGTTPTITYSIEPGSLFAVGTTTVTATATNACGISTCSFTVTVIDNEAPSITCAAAQTQTADAEVCNAAVTVVGPATGDNCGVASVTNSHNNTTDASGTYPVGTTTVTWTVTDIHGNTNTCTQNITVTDNEAPSITCAAAQTQTADAGVCKAAVTVAGPATGDNCGVATVTNSYNNTANASGTYPVGTTVVTWTVTDIHGNSSSCTQAITVTDNEAPVISVSPVLSCFAANNFGCSINLGATATDNCGVLSLTSNAPTCFPVGTTVVTWTATDIHGNVSTATQLVTRNPEINIGICAGPTRTIYTGTTSNVGPFGPQSVNLTSTVTGGTPGYTYNWTPSTGLNNAGIANPVASPTVTTTYTLTVTDSKGCSRTLSITINVLPLSSAVCSGSGNNVKFSVCHIPPGNPSNAHNICISVNALNAHLTSGSNGHNNCYLGPCQQNCFNTVSGAQNIVQTKGAVEKTVETPVIVEEPKDEPADAFKVYVYPNPSAEEFSLKVISNSMEPIRVRIMDMNGTVKSVSNVVSKANMIKVGANLMSGTYMAEITQGENRQVIRLVKLN